MEKKRKRGPSKASQAASTDCGLILLTPNVCVPTLLAPTANSSSVMGTRLAQVSSGG